MDSNDNEQEVALREFLESLKKNIGDMTKVLNFSADQLEEVRNALLRDEPLYRILGMKESMVKARYALAYQLFTAGKFKDAEILFRWLCNYASTTAAHWLGLAACQQARENYAEALEAYQMAALHSSLEDPAPFYYSGICLLKQGKQEEAKAAMQAVLTLSNAQNVEHKSIMDKAEAVLSSLTTKGV